MRSRSVIRSRLLVVAAERVIFVEELGVYRLLLGGNRQDDYQDFMTQTIWQGEEIPAVGDP